MTRELAVAALIGCACGQSSPPPAAPARPTCPAIPACPAVPTVDLTLGRVEPPPPSLVVTEPPEDSVLLRGSGFWCMAFLDGRWAGESDCFRYREPCESWRREYGKRYKSSECRPAERASCVQVTDYKRMGLWYRCFAPAQCEAIRARMMSRRPDLAFTECRESD